MNIRIGQGSDLHRLCDGLPLTIGNCLIPSQKGAVAHSDGDVLIHALIDALLGTMALGDIGSFFPDSDPKFSNISSADLLQQVLDLPQMRRISIINIDCTVHLQRPRLREHIATMREKIATLLKCTIEKVSIKAKSGEDCGPVGNEEAIACDCVVLINLIEFPEKGRI